MRYTKTVDIWAMDRTNIRHQLQVGQWVSAGPPEANRSNVGRFCGVKSGGTIVVAWLGNIRNAASPVAYIQSHFRYGKNT